MSFRSRGLDPAEFAPLFQLGDDELTAPAGEAEAGIRALFANPRIAYIHAHDAAYGCFSAQIDRHEEPGT